MLLALWREAMTDLGKLDEWKIDAFSRVMTRWKLIPRWVNEAAGGIVDECGTVPGGFENGSNS